MAEQEREREIWGRLIGIGDSGFQQVGFEILWICGLVLVDLEKPIYIYGYFSWPVGLNCLNNIQGTWVGIEENPKPSQRRKRKKGRKEVALRSEKERERTLSVVVLRASTALFLSSSSSSSSHYLSLAVSLSFSISFEVSIFFYRRREMATQTPPSAQVVGNAFVEQYYQILHQSPELVHRFYTDMSVLSRPGPDGIMTSVKTMQAINEVIISLDYKGNKAEIKTIDAQDSYQSGVVVLVTGWLTMKNNVKRKFTQSFFLAPQDKGYFVLNDVFRYVDEDSQPETIAAIAVSVDGTTENIPASEPVTSDPEPTPIPDPVPDNTTPTPAVEVAYGNGEVVHEPLSNGEVTVVEVQVVEAPVQPVQNEANPVPEPASTTPEDTPKKLTQSYASILKDTKATKVTKVAPPVSARTNTVKAPVAKAAAGNTEQHSTPAPAPGASAPNSNNGANGSNISEEAEGYSIYIRSLPMNATVGQVEEEFKKFGPIRPNGVQVRSNKGFCFGFVEFEQQSSMQSALEVMILCLFNCFDFF
ncbi:hypothetical protein AQUCO_00200880v1 [Aquilegia coerulea]|uniref:NTF2 domain-containing protein n=1 Tax=Aquilegia coerulea TaxID=218851 RepID=A0A2G5F567_AQUCA|nr:hypothetical protein AQUCO_00200880v1 [Aquilegia coerulea]